MALPNLEDLTQTAVGAALRVRPDLALEPDDVPMMHLSAGPAVMDRTIGIMAAETRAFFIDDAFGDRLKARAAERGVPWRAAEASYGVLTFSRVSTVAEETVDAGTVISTDPDASGEAQSVTIDVALVFPIGVASLPVDATNITEGSAGNVEADTLINGAPAGFTVTNADRFAGGNEDEDDDSLRERVRIKELADRMATEDAVVYAALLVAGVRRVSVVEDELGGTTIYVSDFDGGSNPSMVALVTTALVRVIAKGAAWQVDGGTVVLQNVHLTATAVAGTNTAALASRMIAAVRALMNKNRRGAGQERSEIQRAARNVSDQLTGVTVVVPALDVAPATPDVLILPGTITVG